MNANVPWPAPCDPLPCADCDNPGACQFNPDRSGPARRVREELARQEAAEREKVRPPKQTWHDRPEKLDRPTKPEAAARAIPGSSAEDGATRRKTKAAARAEQLATWGWALWAKLHGRAAAYPEHPTEDERRAEMEWLAGFRGRLPKGGCGCQAEWDAALKQIPPDVSSRAGYFAFTVAVHNFVNAHLRKPIVSEAEARRLWEAVSDGGRPTS